MAFEKRCDRTRMVIVGADAGEGPLIVRDPDGYTIRIEVIEGPNHPERPHLRVQAVKDMIAAATPVPEEEIEGVAQIGRKKSA